VTVAFDRWSQVCLLSWVDEDVSDAVDAIRQALREESIALKDLSIGYGMLEGPTEALEEAAVFSYGL